MKVPVEPHGPVMRSSPKPEASKYSSRSRQATRPSCSNRPERGAELTWPTGAPQPSCRSGSGKAAEIDLDTRTRGLRRQALLEHLPGKLGDTVNADDDRNSLALRVGVQLGLGSQGDHLLPHGA